jgi:hypothetical protein
MSLLKENCRRFAIREPLQSFPIFGGLLLTAQARNSGEAVKAMDLYGRYFRVTRRMGDPARELCPCDVASFWWIAVLTMAAFSLPKFIELIAFGM